MTPFKNQVCWDKEVINSVMDTEALQTKEYYFLATHHPAVMQRVFRGHAEGAREVITEQVFLREFLDSSKKHSHAAIIGSHGSGKSHLVRWIYMKMPQEGNRKVVLIPKLGTNLKDIIARILSGMEGPQFEEYRTRLDKATANLTPEIAREMLLNQLAIAVGNEGPFSKEKLGDRREKQDRDYLVEYLPALFYDNAFRQTFMREGGIIDKLAQHTTGNVPRERLDKRREFTMDDFKPEDWDCKPQEMNAKARKIYMELKANPGGFRENVKSWVNRNLDWAIQSILNFSGEDLNRLMADVRETLAQQGKELVILMEDFAKLQGIDRQLLECLLVRPEQVGRKLCVLRSAMAVTSGYYGGLEETVKDRIDLTVDMDVEDVERERTTEEMARFSARYLNALRVTENKMRKWHESQITLGSDTLPVPNACDSCDNREQCHEAFSASDRISLYPFTPTAITHMYSLIPGESRSFNPRRLINEVLKNTLIRYSDDLKDGAFPPSQMLDRFGGRMPPVRQTELHDMVSADKFAQCRTLIELWGDPSDLYSIAPEIYVAFGLKPVEQRPGGKSDKEKPKPVKQPIEVVEVEQLPLRLQKDLDELTQWSNGGYLSQRLLNDMREKLYEHLSEFIDWDSEMFVKPFYAGSGKAFRESSINFERQDTTHSKPPIYLKLPVDDDFTSTALALQGMLLYGHHQNWSFQNGHRHLRAFIDLLEILSTKIIGQLHQLETEPTYWDPIAPAVELLAIGAQVHGLPPPESNAVEDFINVLFSNWSEFRADQEAERSSTWKKLVDAYVDEAPKVVEILKSRIGCTKGGEIRLQIIDAAAIIKPVNQVRRSWQLTNTVPDRIREDYKPIARLRQRVDMYLKKAVEEERQRFVDWGTGIGKLVTPDKNQRSISKQVKDVASRAFDLGVLPSNLRIQDIDKIINNFESSSILEVVEEVDKLKHEREASKCLPILARSDYANTMSLADKFIAETKTLLYGITQRVESEKKLLESSSDLVTLQKNISTRLSELSKTMSVVEGGQ